jgi:hypothetical protein
MHDLEMYLPFVASESSRNNIRFVDQHPGAALHVEKNKPAINLQMTEWNLHDFRLCRLVGESGNQPVERNEPV